MPSRYHRSRLSSWEESIIRADFHIHTDHSDGLVTAAEAVRRGVAAGLDVMAITDHDAIGGLGEAFAVADELGVTLVPGAELTATLQGHEMHLLAYFHNRNVLAAEGKESLRGFLESVQEARRKRLRAAIQELRMRGVFITEADVFHGQAESYGRLHLARAIQNAGYVKNVNEAFGRFLNEAAGAVPQIEIAPEAITALVHRLGGIVIWAHPSLEEFERHIDALQAAGIDGAETHNFRRRDRLDRLTKQVRDRGLLASGGSDWHGSKQEPPLGTNALGAELAAPLLQAIEERAA